MTGRTPPPYVPTLTDVVGPQASAAIAGPSSQEQLVQRILQRVDRSLDRRLGQAIGTVVLEQTRSLGPLLRDEIEIMVREAVAQAVADELTAGGAPVTPRS